MRPFPGWFCTPGRAPGIGTIPKVTPGSNAEGGGSSPHVYRAAGRVAGKTLRRNRLVNATLHGAGQAFRASARAIRGLFLEIMGLLFCFFALAGGVATYRSYQSLAEDASAERVWLGVLFTLMFTYFAFTSFWRARQK
jgi:hypothetical protein